MGAFFYKKIKKCICNVTFLLYSRKRKHKQIIKGMFYHESEITVKGLEIPVQIQFDIVNDEIATVRGWHYEIQYLNIGFSFEEYIDETAGDGTRDEYEKMILLLGTTEAEIDAIEKVYNEFSVN